MSTVLAVIENPANNFTELQRGYTITDLNGVMHPWQIVDLWSDADLAAINVYRVTPATVPAYQSVTSYTYQRVNGVVTQVLTTVSTPPDITRRQFFQQLSVQSVITQAQALAAVQTGTLPASLQTLINGLPTAEQFGATMLLCAAEAIQRSHPMTVAIGTAYGWTSAQMDTFFITASQL
jgi:hypothetical protein